MDSNETPRTMIERDTSINKNITMDGDSPKRLYAISVRFNNISPIPLNTSKHFFHITCLFH